MAGKPPAAVVPMLALLGKMPPAAQQARFGYDLKWDGYRALVHWDGNNLAIISRSLVRVLGHAIGHAQDLDLPGGAVDGEQDG